MPTSLIAEDSLRIILQASPTATAYWSRDLICRFANDAHRDWFGIEASAMVGMKFDKLLSPARYAKVKPFIDRVLAGTMCEYEVEVQRPGGHRCPTLIRYTPHAVDGGVVGFIAEATDVTLLDRMHADLARILDQQKRTEALLKHSQLALRQAQNLAQIGSWKLDLASGNVEWSEQIYELFGIDPAVPVPGLADQRDWFPEESMKRLSAAVHLCSSIGIPYNIELEYIHRSGRRGWIEARGRAIRDDQGTIVELLGTAQEISSRLLARSLPLREQQIAKLELALARETELRQMAEQSLQHAESKLALPAQRDNFVGAMSGVPSALDHEVVDRTGRLELVGTLACGIAHDFSNVLATVAGANELIARTSTEPRTRSLAAQGQQAVHRASRLVRQLMGLVRDRPAGIDPMQILDVNLLVTEARPILQIAVGPTVALHIEPMPPVYVRLDRHQIETALLNLAVNAGAAMPGGGHLTIRVKLDDPHPADAEKAKLVCIEVQDSGMGMSPETLSKARQAFFTTKAAAQGTGLGLSMVDATMRRAGGTMALESQLGVGTTVRLQFPVVTHVPVAERPEHQLLELDKPMQAAQVLMIERDSTNRAIFSDFLRELGHQVFEVSNQREGFYVAQALSTQLEWVVIDLDAQDMNVDNLSAQFLALNPTIRIIGMASETGLKSDHVVVLQKPFSLNSLKNAMAPVTKLESLV